MLAAIDKRPRRSLVSCAARPPAGRWAVVAILAGGLAAGGCTATAPTGRDKDIAVTVSRGSCGGGWTAPSSGVATFQIHNVDSVGAEVDLIDPGTGGIYAEIEALAPGTTRAMRVGLGRGSYALRCLAEETDAVTGPTVRVSGGSASPAPAVPPVTYQDLTASVKQYRDYV